MTILAAIEANKTDRVRRSGSKYVYSAGEMMHADFNFESITDEWFVHRECTITLEKFTDLFLTYTGCSDKAAFRNLIKYMEFK